MVFDLPENENEQKSNDFYKKLFAEIPDLIFQFSIGSDNAYSFHLISQCIKDIFELYTENFSDDYKTSIYKRIFVSDRVFFLKSLIKAKKEASRWEVEFRCALPQKGLRWLKISSKSELDSDGTISFLGRISDITDAKEKELKLRISEERFQFALEASTTGIWDWDMVNNTVFYSSVSLKILELESTDVFDDPERWDKIVHPDDLSGYYADIREHFENKIPYYENYHRVLTSSGKYKWILDRGKVIERDKNGKPLRVIGTHTDMSEQKEREIELLKTMKLFSEQNSRLLNFSHIVSHNLRTQAGNITALLDFIDLDKKQKTINEMLLHLRTVSNDLNDTILNLTHVVQIQNNLDLVVKPLKLSDYINKTISSIGDYNSVNKATIKNDVPEHVYVDFNPAYLESVLLNLTTNAIRYAHPERTPIIVFGYSIEPDGCKALKITDNGLGIDLEKYGGLLFGMYKTFHKHKEARGIGLYITKNQIEAMEAKVFVESQVGAGTSFKIVFKDDQL